MQTCVKKDQAPSHPRTGLGVSRWIALLLFLAASPVLAQTEEPALPSGESINTDCTDLFPEDPLTETKPGFFSFLDAPQQRISAGLESMAQSIDSFFANEQVFYKSSGSYLRYSVDSLFEEGGRLTTVGKLDISLHLPRTEQKLKLVLESDPVERQSNLQRATTNTLDTAQPETNYYAGLQSEFGKETKWRFSPSVGLKLHFPIEYYVRMRAFRDIRFTTWNLHLTESVYWYDTVGAGADSEMVWERLLDKRLLFRASSLVRNTEEYQRFDLSQVFSISQTLSERRAITYSIGFFGNSEPNIHATDYVLQARYRQIIHGDYLFMELVPQVRYRIDYAFTQEDSLLVRFEWLFRR
ncbi:MAG: hypothetical protein GC149_03860 [Gammaproteobacteria bacterium]|nr:hypothetical protein [Gammaproteobacteria bacterium]